MKSGSSCVVRCFMSSRGSARRAASATRDAAAACAPGGAWPGGRLPPIPPPPPPSWGCGPGCGGCPLPLRTARWARAEMARAAATCSAPGGGSGGGGCAAASCGGGRLLPTSSSSPAMSAAWLSTMAHHAHAVHIQEIFAPESRPNPRTRKCKPTDTFRSSQVSTQTFTADQHYPTAPHPREV